MVHASSDFVVAVDAKVGLMLLFLLPLTTVPGAHCLKPPDVCLSKVAILYSAPSTVGNDGTLTRNIFNNVGEIYLMPGAFTVAITGHLCADESRTFSATSTEVAVTGEEAAPVLMQIAARDRTLEAEGDLPASSVTIVSIVVNPSVIHPGETAVITVGAIGQGASARAPRAYSLAMVGAGSFSPTIKSCGAGISCSISYTATAADKSHLPFTVLVTSADGHSQESARGTLRISNTTQQDASHVQLSSASDRAWVDAIISGGVLSLQLRHQPGNKAVAIVSQALSSEFLLNAIGSKAAARESTTSAADSVDNESSASLLAVIAVMGVMAVLSVIALVAVYISRRDQSQVSPHRFSLESSSELELEHNRRQTAFRPRPIPDTVRRGQPGHGVILIKVLPRRRSSRDVNV